MPLPSQAVHWYTPDVSSGGRSLSPETTSTGVAPSGRKVHVGLENQARQWPTPTSLGFADSHQPGNSYSYNKTMELADPISRHSLPDPATCEAGEPPSKERRSLNPLFVEWLMGWPPGWTLLGWIDFACSATALSLYRQRTRSALSRIALPTRAPPAQISLF
jgi:hypothetical protein